jgi:hypothetical protein
MHRRTALSTIAGLAGAAAAPALAMYDPPPDKALVLAPGAWAGTLTYRDWTNPDKLVTLRCRLWVALTAPNALALYYVFDDGPGKTVYSYEKMTFDFPAATLLWTSGTAKPSAYTYRLGAVQAGSDDTRLAFERDVSTGVERHALALSQRTWLLEKTDVSAAGAATFRNRYELVRSVT